MINMYVVKKIKHIPHFYYETVIFKILFQVACTSLAKAPD